MATTAQWIEGARPRTLPAAIAPVLVGTGAAAGLGSASWWRALLALGVALWLQIGVNYANDYSDGVKGTDERRVGPLRLVGSGAASASAVKRAALLSFAIAAAFGFALSATSSWWLLLAGAAALPAAWGYTGGKRPYGYRGLGEISVFVFFGLVAVLGTCYAQADAIDRFAVSGAIGIGALACALLVVNNVRDIPSDTEAGKHTLAVRLGDRRTRRFFLVLILTAYAGGAFCAAQRPWAWLFLISLPFVIRALRVVFGTDKAGNRAVGLALIPALRDTGLAELTYAIGLGIGLIFT